MCWRRFKEKETEGRSFLLKNFSWEKRDESKNEEKWWGCWWCWVLNLWSQHQKGTHLRFWSNVFFLDKNHWKVEHCETGPPPAIVVKWMLGMEKTTGSIHFYSLSLPYKCWLLWLLLIFVRAKGGDTHIDSNWNRRVYAFCTHTHKTARFAQHRFLGMCCQPNRYTKHPTRRFFRISWASWMCPWAAKPPINEVYLSFLLRIFLCFPCFADTVDGQNSISWDVAGFCPWTAS